MNHRQVDAGKNVFAPLAPWIGASVVFACVAFATAKASAADAVRPTAVLDVTFDEDSGDPKNAAPPAAGKGLITLQNGAERTPSPFWNQLKKRALLLDAKKKQFAQVAVSPYLDRPDGVTIAFYFLSLHDSNDDGFHGLVAKRVVDEGRTNYGINFNPAKNLLQLYINDGSGFREVVFDARSVIASRRLVHLAATFQMGDAPVPDADTAADDLLVRLYLNGQPVKPVSVAKGQVAGNDAWITDVDPAGFLNDAPLTIGATNPATEYTSGVFDELLVFKQALDPSAIAALFAEVAGPNGAQLAREEIEQKPQPEAPRITALSLNGLQRGATTRVTIQGTGFEPEPRVVLPLEKLKQTAVAGSNSSQLIVDLEVPAETRSGYYPLCVQTKAGLSNTVAVAVDRFPQLAAAQTSPQAAASLPGAFSGTVSGTEQARVYFHGTAGQKLVADVEARRLGAAFDPVLEIKNELATPLQIEWGRVALRGDPRAEFVLPADGVYFAEIHDLSYNAPGRGPYRLTLGDMKLVDALFPPVAARGAQVSFEPVGTGIAAGTRFAAKLPDDPKLLDATVPIPTEAQPAGPSPVVPLSDGVEIIETPEPPGQLQTISALFARDKRRPVSISGRISSPGEQDRYLLVVTPGEKLVLSVQGRAIDSPIDASLSVLKHPEGTPLASDDDVPGSRDPRLEYAVPADVHEIQVVVGDLLGKGGPRYMYRLQIVPAGRPDFNLKLATPRISIPAGGSALGRLVVERNGYSGPIRLHVTGDEKVAIAPAEIPAGDGTQTVLVTLIAKDRDAGSLENLQIVGESADLNPPIHRAATVAPGGDRADVRGFGAWLPAAITAPPELSVSVKGTPPTLWKGLPATLVLDIGRSGNSMPRAAQFTLVSTEQPRQRDRNNRAQGSLPLVRAEGGESVDSSASTAQMKLVVPVDVAQNEIDFVVRADVVPHSYSRVVKATTYSQPFRLNVAAAAAVTLDAASLTAASGTDAKVRGTLKRSAGFSQPVELSLRGLPKGYQTATVTVPPDKDQFELSLKVPKEAAAGDVPNVKLRVESGGRSILPEQPVALKAQAPAK